jgi:hypothetical protein
MEEEAKTRENGKGYEGEAVVKKKKVTEQGRCSLFRKLQVVLDRAKGDVWEGQEMRFQVHPGCDGTTTLDKVIREG